MKKLCAILCAFGLALSMTACASEQPEGPVEENTDPVVEDFSAEYEVKGTTSRGQPKCDTFVFEGKTTDGIITELNFDIIRDKGTEKELSKKDIMGYLMNISDATIEKTDAGLKLTYTANSLNNELSQYMLQGTCENLTEETTFKDLTFGSFGQPYTLEQALGAYKNLAKEGNIELTPDTKMTDLLAIHGLYADGKFIEGTQRVSFEGLNGGRSYGEQIDAIAAHILANNMTLEDVYEMFKTENQPSSQIEDRDAVSGATITFVGDFQRMVYMAINGELFEGVTNSTTDEAGNTKVEVVTQGFGGEVETHVTFDGEGKIVSVAVRDAQETADVGAKLYEEGSEFLTALAEGKTDVVSGATVTSNALINAVNFAKEYFAGLQK